MNIALNLWNLYMQTIGLPVKYDLMNKFQCVWFSLFLSMKPTALIMGPQI